MLPLGVNVVVFNAQGQVLLTRREDYDVWCLPGGAVDPGESLGAAARREVLEETGLVVALERLVGLYSRGTAARMEHVIVFSAGVLSGSLCVQPGENTACQWFDPSALPDDLLVPQRLRIQHALAGMGGSLAWNCPLDWRYPPEVDYPALLQLAGASGLGRREYHRRYLNSTQPPGMLLEAGPPDYRLPPGALRVAIDDSGAVSGQVAAGKLRVATNAGALSAGVLSAAPTTAPAAPAAPAKYGSAVAVMDGERLLLTRRNDYDVWCLPGGHAEAGESIAETARREIEEETGLQIALTGLVGVYSKLNWLGRGIHVFLLRARVTGGSLRPQPEEVTDLRFFDPHDLPADFFYAHDRMAADALSGAGSSGGACGSGGSGSSAVWTQAIPHPFPHLTQPEIYALRDQSGLPRAEFYRRHTALGREWDEVGGLA